MNVTVRAHPGASRARVEWDGEKLEVWVTARAVEGAANRALVEAIATALAISPSRITIRHGTRGRLKQLEIEDLPLAALEHLARAHDS